MTAIASATTTSVPRHPRRPKSFATTQPALSAPDPQVLPDERAVVVESRVLARRRAHLDDRDPAAEPHLHRRHLTRPEPVGEADLTDPAAERLRVGVVLRDDGAAELVGRRGDVAHQQRPYRVRHL